MQASSATTSITGRRFGYWPAEGWLTIGLHLALVVLMATSVANVSDANSARDYVVAAVVALLFGWFMAAISSPGWLSHSLAIIAGVALGFGLSVLEERQDGTSWNTAVAAASRMVRDVWTNGSQQEEFTSTQVQFLTILLIWFVAYGSAWLLYRSRWLAASLALPGSVMLASVAADRTNEEWLPLLFLALSLVLAARYNAFRRFSAWQMQGYDVPAAPAMRFAVAGVLIAVTSIMLAQTASLDGLRRQVESVADQSEGLIEQAGDRLDEMTGDNASVAPAAGYASFDDAFSIDGELNLSQEPAVLVRSQLAVYLAGRRLDTYDGQNWTSSASEMPAVARQPEENKTVLVTFGPQQQMNLSSDQQNQREPRTVEIVPLGDLGNVVLTIETHLSAEPPTAVSMRWMTIEETYTVASIDLSRVPVELQPIMSLLQSATFVDDGTAAPAIAEPDLTTLIASEREQLQRKYPVSTNLQWSPEGPLLTVQGRLPVYDDVQAVFDNGGAESTGSYQVTGLVSTASVDQMMATASELPEFLYPNELALPGTVTDRTRDLAFEIAGGAGGGYAAAVAIEAYLRTLTYNLNVEPPPDGQDAVDFFLFERPEGRCTHFASAMVVMMRSLGYPARVVAGFAPGEYSSDQNGFVSRFSDAHTWVEVYIPGYGWIPFEPTPSKALIERESAGAPGVEAEPTPEPQAESTPPPTPPTAEASPVAGITTTSSGDGSASPDPLLAAPLLLGGLMAVGLIAALALWRRGLQGLEPPAVAFAKARRIGRLWHVNESPVMTPTEYAGEFAAAVPVSKPAIDRITIAYELKQYGPRQAQNALNDDAISAWRDLRSILRTWRPWGRG